MKKTVSHKGKPDQHDRPESTVSMKEPEDVAKPVSAWAYMIDHRGIRDKEPLTLCAIEPPNETPVSIAKEPDLA